LSPVVDAMTSTLQTASPRENPYFPITAYHRDMSERWPDLTVLELLVAVSEHGSLSAAARSTGMAQPNATRALARFERASGLRLLDRTPRGSQLTSDGAMVVDWARDVLDSARRMRVATDALRGERRSHLTIAASMTVAEALMPSWLAELRRRHPSLEIRLLVQNSEEVFDLVMDAACDVGFVESPGVRRGLRSTMVARDRLAVVVSPSHTWARRTRPVSGAELARTPLVVREPGSGTRTTLEAALAGFEPVPPTLELGSNAAVRVSVAAGAGPAVLSELVVGPPIRSGELVEVPTSGIPLERTMRAVWHGQGPVHGAAGDLVLIARRGQID
jgi:DNA-binding transcriptional LysR family regulator